jgi:hypothetical protein
MEHLHREEVVDSSSDEDLLDDYFSGHGVFMVDLTCCFVVVVCCNYCNSIFFILFVAALVQFFILIGFVLFCLALHLCHVSLLKSNESR